MNDQELGKVHTAKEGTVFNQSSEYDVAVFKLKPNNARLGSVQEAYKSTVIGNHRYLLARKSTCSEGNSAANYEDLPLEQILLDLSRQGCYPCVALHGHGTWRAHVNATGSYWDEGPNLKTTLISAIRLWEKAGRPMDGYAAYAVCA